MNRKSLINSYPAIILVEKNMGRKIIELIIGTLVITLMLPSLVAIPNNGISIDSTNEILMYQEKNDMQLQTSEDDPLIRIISQDTLRSSFFDEFENDMGYNIDVPERIQGSAPFYVGEQVDTAPGRTRTGSLDPDSGDDQDWYRFFVCEGQTIQASLTTAQDFEIHLFGRGLSGDLKGKLTLIIGLAGEELLAGFGVQDQDLALAHRCVWNKLTFRVDGVSLGKGENQHPMGQGGG